MAFTLFRKQPKVSPEEAFWQWFAKNEMRLFEFERDEANLTDELEFAIRRVHQELTFEIGPVERCRRTFVISAGGDLAVFPAVESLHSKAPDLKRWDWIKFRPPISPPADYSFGELVFPVEEVRYLLQRTDSGVSVVLFFDGYCEEEKHIFWYAADRFLAEALGEYAVATQVGSAELQSRESELFSQALPLAGLAEDFQQYFRQAR